MMRLMHHQELQKEHQKHIRQGCSLVCHPNDVTLPHKQLHGTFGRTEEGRVTSLTNCTAGYSCTYKVPFIMKSMQITPLAQITGPGNPGTLTNGPPSRYAAMYACSEHRLAAAIKTRLAQPCWPSKSASICAKGGIADGNMQGQAALNDLRARFCPKG